MSDPANNQNPTESFLNLTDVELATVDRTPLEGYATCPAMQIMIDRGGVNTSSAAAASGQEVHSVLSQVVQEYIDLGASGELRISDLKDSLDKFVNASRPDVQPDVAKALRASGWEWCKFLAGGSLHPHNIMRFDGGVGTRSGQLAMDIPDLGIRVTSEIDFLYATPSVEQLAEIDWKSGNKIYTAATVASSFQFQLHAVLVFHNYPGVRSLIVRVWNTRINRISYAVEFVRDDLPRLEGRVRQATRMWRMCRPYVEHEARAIPDEMYWPTVEKCGMCDAVLLCRFAGNAEKEMLGEPGLFVDRIVTLEAGLKAMKKLVGAHVDKTKEDIVSVLGNAYGNQKPKSKSKPIKAIYRVVSENDEADEAETEGADE